MRRGGRSALLGLLPVFLAGLMAVGSASASDAAPVLEAGDAPPGCWTMRDGCPAGTGAVPTPGIRAPFETAWTFETEAGAEIEEAPRVWGDLVFVAVRQGPAQRALVVLGLGDGRPLAEPVSIASDQPLDPCVWGEVVLVREAPSVLASFRLDADGLTRQHVVRGEDTLYAPLLVGEHVYAVDGTALVCWRLGTPEPVWRLAGEYRGSLAVRGASLFALSVDPAGNIHVTSVDRHTGAGFRPEFIGHWQREGVPPEGVIASVSAMPGNVLVQHAQVLQTSGESTARTSWLQRRPMSGGTSILSQIGLLDFERAPVAAGDGWLSREHDDEEGPVLRLSRVDPGQAGQTKGWILASRKQRPEFLGDALPLSVAGNTAYLGARAFDWRTREVVWDGGADLRHRTVPAHDTLLVVPAPGRLLALREQGAALGGGLFTGRAHAVGTPEATGPVALDGAVVFADGTVHQGAYELAADGKALTLHTQKGRRTRSADAHLGRVRLLLDTDDRLLYVNAPANLEAALARYHFSRLVDDYVRLAKDAYRTHDPELMLRLIEDAAARGATERDLAHARKQQAALVTRPRKHDARRREAILEREQKLAADGAARTRQTLVSVLDDPRWPVQQAFARRLLTADPDHERAAALVRARLPAFLPAPEPFRALEWIDLVDALEHAPVTQLQPPAGERPDLTRQEREFGSALHTWRKDLVGLEAGEMLILTPLAKPGRIGTCLSMGTLVCRALEDVFRSGTAVRTKPYPLIMRLYETQQEYLDASAHGRDRRAAERRANLTQTLGHYDPESGITRVFLPPVADAWQEVLSTYAHEVTHHWIEERCPLFESRAGRRSSTLPGYWIVEGMAVFLEEFRWDLKARTWSAANPRAASLDVVANATPEQLIPWRRLYALNGTAFFRLDRDDKREIPMRWMLGSRRLMSEWRMFYAQAAATTHYLYHAGEKERAALLAFVGSYYTHALPAKVDPIQAGFGISSDELGRRVREWARAQNVRLDALPVASRDR